MFDEVNKVAKSLLIFVFVIIGLLVCVLYVYTDYSSDDRNSADDSLLIEFNDIEEDSKEMMIARWAVSNGIVRGYLDGSFRPNEEIKEYQLMIILYSYFGMGDISYITSMLEDSNINAKNIDMVYKRLRTAGVFVKGTSDLKDVFDKRDRVLSNRDVVEVMAWLSQTGTHGEDVNKLYDKFKIDKDRVDVNVRKIDLLEMLYVMNKDDMVSSSDLILNETFNFTESYIISGEDPKYVMYDDNSGMGMTLEKAIGYGNSNDVKYVLEVRNLGKIPYEYFGISVMVVGDGGVRSVEEKEDYFAIGGSSVINIVLDYNDTEKISLVLGNQITDIEDSVLSMMDDLESEDKKNYSVDGITLTEIDKKSMGSAILLLIGE